MWPAHCADGDKPDKRRVKGDDMFQVVQSNVGRVFTTDSETEALRAFRKVVRESADRFPAYRNVTLFKGDEIIKENVVPAGGYC